MKLKKGFILTWLMSVGMFVTGCDASTSTNLDSIWQKLISLGNLSFLGLSGGSSATGFLRILILILVFALLYEITRALNLRSGAVTAVAWILAIIVAIAIPPQVLVGIAATYGTIVGVLLIAVPIAGGLWALSRIQPTNWGTVALRIIILIIILWVMVAMKQHATLLLQEPSWLTRVFGGLFG